MDNRLREKGFKIADACSALVIAENRLEARRYLPLQRADGIHPAGSTVSEQTLNRLGYSAPDMYASRSTDDAGELLAN